MCRWSGCSTASTASCGSPSTPTTGTSRGGVSVALADVTGDGVAGRRHRPRGGRGPARARCSTAGRGAMVRSFFAYDPSFAGGVTVAVGRRDRGRGGGRRHGDRGGRRPARSRCSTAGTGAEVRSFFAYDPAFRGGVSVAAGDVDGDGGADVITAAGPGGGPPSQVFDGRTGPMVRSFFAYDPGFRGGVYVAAGDVDGDGLADIVTGAGPGGGPMVVVFNGATGQPLEQLPRDGPRVPRRGVGGGGGRRRRRAGGSGGRGRAGGRAAGERAGRADRVRPRTTSSRSTRTSSGGVRRGRAEVMPHDPEPRRRGQPRRRGPVRTGPGRRRSPPGSQKSVVRGRERGHGRAAGRRAGVAAGSGSPAGRSGPRPGPRRSGRCRCTRSTPGSSRSAGPRARDADLRHHRELAPLVPADVRRLGEEPARPNGWPTPPGGRLTVLPSIHRPLFRPPGPPTPAG